MPTFTADDYAALDPADRRLVEAWILVHDVDPNDVTAIDLLSEHMVAFHRIERPARVVDDQLVMRPPLTTQALAPFPVEVAR